MLQPHTTYTVTIVCNAMQYYPDESRWYFPYVDKDQQREQVEQTTTFSFTTGDAPSYVPDKIVNFTYPVTRQRYVLKQELGGKGALRVDQWQTNLFPDNGGTITSQRDYRLYFIDNAAKDTIKTNFTADHNNNTINYTLPANLKNNTVYTMEFYSLPKASLTAMKINTKISTSTRTSGNINYAVKQTSVTGSAPQGQNTNGPIYTLYFRTSQYNTFSDKMQAMGNWNGTHSGDNVLINSDGASPEPFDQYEVKGFNAPDGTYYPSLFQARIEWNSSQQDDKFADDNLYANAFTLAFKLVNTNFAVPDLREQIYKPVNTLYWDDFTYDAPLSFAETNTSSKAGVKSSINIINTSSNQTTNTSASVSKSGYSMSLSSNFGVKQNNTTLISSKLIQSHQIKWSRDYYIRQDYNLLAAFGLTAQTQAAILQHQLDPGDQESTLAEMDGDINFASNNIGGSVTMPWNKFYYLYTDPKSMAILNNLRYLKFTGISQGSRIINFHYQAGWMQGTLVTKSFTIK